MAVTCLLGAGSKAEAMQGCCPKPRDVCAPSIWAAQGSQRSGDTAHRCRECRGSCRGTPTFMFSRRTFVLNPLDLESYGGMQLQSH